MLNPLIAVRAVTAFIVLDPDQSSWTQALESAVGFTARLSDKIKAAGCVSWCQHLGMPTVPVPVPVPTHLCLSVRGCVCARVRACVCRVALEL